MNAAHVYKLTKAQEGTQANNSSLRPEDQKAIDILLNEINNTERYLIALIEDELQGVSKSSQMQAEGASGHDNASLQAQLEEVQQQHASLKARVASIKAEALPSVEDAIEKVEKMMKATEK